MSHRTTLIQLLGGVGLVAGDVFALLSVFGSARLLIMTLVADSAGGRVGACPNRFGCGASAAWPSACS